jgi:hypothetical protein
MSSKRFMFDTNVFNRILDGQLSMDANRCPILAYATHIQRDEINNTTDRDRRTRLLEVFHEETTESVPTNSFVLGTSRLDEACLARDRVIPTSSAVWDTSRWDEASWGDEDSIFALMKAELDSLNRGKVNNVQDILIAETALKKKLTLVTDDSHLRAVFAKVGGEALSVAEFALVDLESAT